jgi:uncharacterized protein involved in exopolysaccharide biosynthesis
MLDRIRVLIAEGVDLAELPREMWRNQRRVATLVFGPVVVASLAFIFVPRWYMSGATLTVDTGSLPSNVSSVLGLASQLGFAGGVGATSPQFYSDLFASRALQERIVTARFPLPPSNKLSTLEAYWTRDDSASLRTRERALKILRKHMSASANTRTGVISFSIEGPSRYVAKLMADTALAILNDIVLTIRRQRAAAEREFLETRWLALRDSLTAHENVLRAFYERNRVITSPELQFEDVRLRREVERVQSVYALVGGQLEQARIQEVRDTPAISIIDRPVEPVKKSSPRLRLWVITAGILGCALALISTLGTMASRRLEASPA